MSLKTINKRLQANEPLTATQIQEKVDQRLQHNREVMDNVRTSIADELASQLGRVKLAKGSAMIQNTPPLEKVRIQTTISVDLSQVQKYLDELGVDNMTPRDYVRSQVLEAGLYSFDEVMENVGYPTTMIQSEGL